VIQISPATPQSTGTLAHRPSSTATHAVSGTSTSGRTVVDSDALAAGLRAGIGLLSPGLTSTSGGSGRSGAIAGALAPGTASIGAKSTGSPGPLHIHLKQIVPPLSTTGSTVIDRFIKVIPTGVWIALAAALAFAALAGAAALRSGRRIRLQETEVATVTAAARTDALTGVLNRRGFLEAAERELDRAQRYGHPLALAFVDIRGLKAVNDTEGHLAGDRLLKRVTSLLRESARTHDLVGRIGGDELAVLLAEQSADGAAAMTQRVRAQVPAYRRSLGLVTPWDVTIGTAAFPEDGETFEKLLAAADRRLYQQRGIDLAS
jgi:diguanylate cyclase (GGDEF)-like protein